MKRSNWKEFTPDEIVEAYSKNVTWKTQPSCFWIPANDWVQMFGIEEDVALEFACEIIDQWNGEVLEKEQERLECLVFKTAGYNGAIRFMKEIRKEVIKQKFYKIKPKVRRKDNEHHPV